MVITESPGLGVVAVDSEMAIDTSMTADELEPPAATDDEVAVFTIRGPSSARQVA